MMFLVALSCLLVTVTAQTVVRINSLLIVYPASSCASQQIELHRYFNFWPNLLHILSIFVISEVNP